MKKTFIIGFNEKLSFATFRYKGKFKTLSSFFNFRIGDEALFFVPVLTIEKTKLFLLTRR